MSSSWCLHERTKLGGDGERWHLSSEEELRVGRGSDSNIKFQSQSVESRHAVFSWDPKTVAFALKDLGSVNGTYVNNRPLRGISVVLKHNDSIRFGYDKDRVFRIEECFSTAKNSPATKASTESTQRLPHVSVSSSCTPPPTSQTSTDHTPLPASIHVESEQKHPIPTIQHGLPILSTEDDLTSSLGSPQRSDGRRSVDVEHTPALNKASKLYGKPDWWGEVGPGQENMAEARRREFEFIKPGSQILRQLDPPAPEVRRDSAPKLSLKDELRLQSMSSADPATSWVIDFGGGGSGGTLPRVRRARDHIPRPRSADPSPNRLTSRRDPSPIPKRAITPTSSRSASFSVATPPTTAPGMRRQRETTPPIVRSADTASRRLSDGDKMSSPKRKTQKKPNPLIATPQPGSPKHSKPSSPRCSKPPSPGRSKPPSPGGSKPPSPGGSKPPHAKSLQSKPPRSKAEARPSDPSSPPRSRTFSPPDSSDTPSDLPHITSEDSLSSIDLKHLNSGGKMSHLVRDDETYTALPVSSDESNSISSLSDHTLSPPTERPAVVVTSSGSVGGHGERMGTEGEEGHSATTTRKQWTNDEAQSPDSLMIANIEARMRRLSKLAHQTARQVTGLKNRIQEGYQMEVKGVDYLSLRDTSPVVTRAEQHLPEWKSFNKEAHSIFRNIRVVEKWLQDIDGTLSSIKAVNASASGDETVDLASDGELYLDSMDAVESTSNSELSDN